MRTLIIILLLASTCACSRSFIGQTNVWFWEDVRAIAACEDARRQRCAASGQEWSRCDAERC